MARGTLPRFEKHRLHNIDTANRVADCETCGRQVDIHPTAGKGHRRGGWTPYEWVCGPKYRYLERQHRPVDFAKWEETHK